MRRQQRRHKSVSPTTTHIIAACLLLGQVDAVNSGPNPNNFYFNPFLHRNITKLCDVPPYQKSSNQFMPRDSMCKNNASATPFPGAGNDQVIQALAVAYAPYLYFHPLEQFTMSSVNRTLRNASLGEIYLDHGEPMLVDEQLNQTTLMRTTRDRDFVLQSHRFFFQHLAVDEDARYDFKDAPRPAEFRRRRRRLDDVSSEAEVDNEYKIGDGFSKVGRALAPIYYTVFDSGNGTATFNYYFYYTWNGPNSFGVLTSHNGTEQYVTMIMSPWGTHEGDWETMSVTVCQAETPSQPLAVTYRQSGGFGQMLDCTKGECTFQWETETHPVGFVALHSHEVYAWPVKNLVYDEAWPLEFWVNLQGFLSIHRTAYADLNGNFRFYQPDEANVIRLADQEHIPDRVHESRFWEAFGGRWGRPTANESAFIATDYPFCLDNSTVNSTVPCPDENDNPIWYIVMQMLGVNKSTTPLIEAAFLLVNFLTENHLGTSPFGPAAHPNYRHLGSVKNAPIYRRVLDPTDTGAEYCRRLGEIPDTFRLPPEQETLPLIRNIYGIIIMCTSFTVGTFIYFLSWEKIMPKRQIFTTDERGRLLPVDRKAARFWIFHMAVVYTVAYAVCWTGTILFYIGYDRLLKLLEQFFQQDYSTILNVLLVVGVMLVCFDSLMLVLLWCNSVDLWRKANRTYFEIVGDEDGLLQFQDKQRCELSPKRSHRGYSVLYGTLFLSLIFAVCMAVAGVFNVGLAFAIGEICRGVIGSLEGICFRFLAFGMKEIRCGEDFHHFCNEWAQGEMILTLWGAFIVVVGHFYLISSVSVATMQHLGVRRVLALLPSREEYIILTATTMDEDEQNFENNLSDTSTAAGQPSAEGTSAQSEAQEKTLSKVYEDSVASAPTEVVTEQTSSDVDSQPGVLAAWLLSRVWPRGDVVKRSEASAA